MTTVTDWIVSISTMVYTAVTAGLFIAAIVAGVYARRAWQEQKRANDARDTADSLARDAQASAQASTVSGWVEREGDYYVVKLSNASTQPIYDVAWTVNGHGEVAIPHYEHGWVGLVPPGPPYSAGRFNGNAWKDLREHGRGRKYDLDEVLKQPGNWRVEIVFQDASMRDWTRTDKGHLVEGRPAPPPELD